MYDSSAICAKDAIERIVAIEIRKANNLKVANYIN